MKTEAIHVCEWKSDPLVKTQTTAVYEGTAGCAHKRQGMLRAA